MQNVFLAIPLALDSFALCIDIGALGGTRSRGLLAASIFGAADAGGTALGLYMAPYSSVRWSGLSLVAPTAIVLYAALVLFSTATVRTWAGSVPSLVALACVMGLDNLAAGALGDDASPSAVASFLATGMMAFAGFLLGGALARRWPLLTRALPGGAALAAALIMGLG